MTEEVVTFLCEGSQLVGILHRAESACSHGVLIVVGGPQYRVGSHRQFTLLARRLASEGIAVMRFDYRGMGDSEGATRSFDDIGDDIRAAIDEFLRRVEKVRSIVIWGLCDAASAAILYAPGDARVSSLVLLNPWVRTEAGAAKTYIRHYYVKRLFSAAMWGKILRGDFDYRGSISSFAGLLGKSLLRRNTATDASGRLARVDLPARMCASLERFDRPTLFILSGNQDYVASEFRDVAGRSACWKKALARRAVTRMDLAEANHTFSSAEWRGRVESWTADWVKRLELQKA